MKRRLIVIVLLLLSVKVWSQSTNTLKIEHVIITPTGYLKWGIQYKPSQTDLQIQVEQMVGNDWTAVYASQTSLAFVLPNTPIQTIKDSVRLELSPGRNEFRIHALHPEDVVSKEAEIFVQNKQDSLLTGVWVDSLNSNYSIHLYPNFKVAFYTSGHFYDSVPFKILYKPVDRSFTAEYHLGLNIDETALILEPLPFIPLSRIVMGSGNSKRVYKKKE